MDKKAFRKFLRECITEVIAENLSVKEAGNITIKAPPAPNIRKSWGDMNPVSRIHGQGKQGKKPKYDRTRDKNWKSDLDEGRRVCAWCKKDMGQAPTDLDSHGICPTCLEKMKADVKARGNQQPKGIAQNVHHSHEPDLEESGWTVKPEVEENEFDGKKAPKHDAKVTPEELNKATEIAKRIWSNDMKKIELHSKSLDGRTSFYRVNTNSTYYRWLSKNEKGQWHYTDGEGIRSKWVPFDETPEIKEMTGTSAVQGFYGKNWVDPDPTRKRMKSIAAKSVGGKVT